MALPTFIGIGAQKCATTWLYDLLRDHPQAALSARKELDFFSHQFDRGFDWYERQFPAAARAAVGEFSPSYFHEPAVPGRIRRHLPAARLILSLRDPVERALSHHRHAVRVGDVAGPDLRFESALARNPSYIEQGRYATHLERWLAHFPREQLLVIFYEEIASDPAAVARRLYRFLGIDPEHRPQLLGACSNFSHLTPHPSLERARRGLRLAVARAGLAAAWELAARSGARRLYRRLNRRPSGEAIPPAAPHTLATLRGQLRGEMEQLERITGRDLRAWRTAPAEQTAAGDAAGARVCEAQ